jgi:hypothetical protein
MLMALAPSTTISAVDFPRKTARLSQSRYDLTATTVRTKAIFGNPSGTSRDDSQENLFCECFRYNLFKVDLFASPEVGSIAYIP